MPRNKSPKKRKQHKPGKPGRSPADGRIPYRRHPKSPHLLSTAMRPRMSSFMTVPKKPYSTASALGLSFFSTRRTIRPWSRLSGVLSSIPVMQRGPDTTVPMPQ